MGFFDDVGTIFDVGGVLNDGFEEVAGFVGVDVGGESVGVVAEGVQHGEIIFGVAGGEMATFGGGGEGLGEFGDLAGLESFDYDASFFGGGDGVADFGLEGIEEFAVGLVEGDDVLPLFVGSGGETDFALRFEVIVEVAVLIEGEFFYDVALVVEDG